MVLPVQQVSGVGGDPDAELAFGLTARSPSVHWITPDEIEEALLRSPGVQASARGLPVGVFLAAEVRRIGDPLFGHVRRLSALVDAEIALLPVRMAREENAAGEGVVRAHAALVQVRTGRVLWYGVEEGAPAEVGDPRGLASAVDVLARTLLWYEG